MTARILPSTGARSSPRHRRRAALLVEGAFVFPVVVFLLLMIVVGGVGVFRYQQVACLGREAARYASVHGSNFARDADLPSPANSEIVQSAVLPHIVGMNPADLAVTVEWVNKATNEVVPWDDAPKDVLSITESGEYVTNAVRVTVVYTYRPGALFVSQTLESTCEVPMSS